MPQAATHILVPLILMSIIRDFYIRKNGRKSFPLHYVLIAGIAGAIPDLDVAAFWVLNSFGFTFYEVHRTFMHSLFIPLILLVLSAATIHEKIPTLGRHKLRLHIIFLMMALGTIIHLFLDATLVNYIYPLYPLSHAPLGLDLFGHLPKALEIIAPGTLDGILIIAYIVYLELKHKISDFI